ncbi:MAG: hypothetical protein HYU66_20575 [Armatimonadetes bacterium]|nr:hypothetical protein [Armatimonadota bacterium]
MSIVQEYLEILRCPETRQPVELADEALVARLNALIAAGSLTARGGEAVAEPIDGGLVREDGQVLYPIRDEVPYMLIADSIALADLPAEG